MIERALSRLNPQVRALWDLYPESRRSHIGRGGFALAIAAILAWGAPTRLTAAAYETVNATGGKWPWAAVWLVCFAALTVAPTVSTKAMARTLRVAACLHLLFAVGFLASAIGNPLASFLGFAVFGHTAFQHISAAEFYRSGR